MLAGDFVNGISVSIGRFAKHPQALTRDRNPYCGM